MRSLHPPSPPRASAQLPAGVLGEPPELPRLTHPERIVDAGSGVTKAEVAAYYAQVAEWIAPHLAGRPAALLRAPDGLDAPVFFQKHPPSRYGLDGVREVAIDADSSLLDISVPQGLLACVQWNAIEFHTVGARSRRPDLVERLTFDLDPGEGVEWASIADAAQRVRVLLEQLGLPTFLKTSGGRGLHVVVPLSGRNGWERAKAFAKSVAEHLARTQPERFVAIAGPKHRVGRVFVDYLRNQAEATAVCAWSLRARPGLPVSVPLDWDELDAREPQRLTLRDVLQRHPQGNDPWRGYEAARTGLAKAERELARAGRKAAHAAPPEAGDG